MQRSINFNMTKDDQKIELRKLQSRMIRQAKTEYYMKTKNTRSLNRKLEGISNRI
jgi:hypothetical protein